MVGRVLRIVETLQFAVPETNPRSRRAIENIGATLTDGTEQRATAGKLVPYCIYEVGGEILNSAIE